MVNSKESNIVDYLAWRGDLSFRDNAFNPVDNLIFSVFAYLPLDGIVPPDLHRHGPTAEEVVQALDSLTLKDLQVRSYAEQVTQHINLFRQAAKTKRFAKVRLSGFQNRYDKDVETQFAAVCFCLEDGSHFVAFRGTDMTVVGWKEDFTMSFMTPVPAQSLALEYLEQAAHKLFGPFRIGGHSKGGNLAVYAAAFSSWRTKRRIISVYNNDGPGFDDATIAMKGFKFLQGRLYAYVPQSSIIGMLLEHSETYTIVQSTQKGIAQHNPYSWVVRGPNFVCMDTVTDTSRFIDKTIKDWLSSLTTEERRKFVDALFDILQATEITSFSELSTNWFQRARAMGEVISNLDGESRTMLIKILGILFETVKTNITLLLPFGERI